MCVCLCVYVCVCVKNQLIFTHTKKRIHFGQKALIFLPVFFCMHWPIGTYDLDLEFFFFEICR